MFGLENLVNLVFKSCTFCCNAFEILIEISYYFKSYHDYSPFGPFFSPSFQFESPPQFQTVPSKCGFIVMERVSIIRNPFRSVTSIVYKEVGTLLKHY